MRYPLDANVMRLYAITAPGAAADPAAKDRARAWLEAGVRMIQLREKNVPRESLVPFGRYLRALTAEYDALFIVNDDPHLAALLDADGVHLGQEDARVSEARRILGRDKILGLSTHDQRQVLEAADMDVDYLGVGPVFTSTTKNVGRPLLGPEFAGWAWRKAQQPVVAIGGIQLANVGRIVAEGCRNVAVVSAINAHPRPGDVVRAFLGILNAPVESAGAR